MAKSESTKIEFGYFHDYESEQFAFYRIPKVLFTDEYFRNLSSDARIMPIPSKGTVIRPYSWVERKKRH